MRMRVKNTGELIEVYPYPVKGKMQFKHATADRYFTWEELTPDSVRSSAQQGSVSDICMQVTPTISGSVTTITKD